MNDDSLKLVNDGNVTQATSEHTVGASTSATKNTSQVSQDSLSFHGKNLFTKPSVNKSSEKTKRALSSTSSVTGDDPDKTGTRLQKKKKKEDEVIVTHKVIKTMIDASIAKIPSTVSDTFPIGYEQLYDFLASMVGVKINEATLAVSQYTDNLVNYYDGGML